MSRMFLDCHSFQSLPYISKSVLNKNKKKEDKFGYCDEKMISKKFKVKKYLIILFNKKYFKNILNYDLYLLMKFNEIIKN